MAISAIITEFNENLDLCKTLESLIDNTTLLSDVVIVDDGSDIESNVDHFQIRHPAIRFQLRRHDTRMGVGCSREEACRASIGSFFAILDAHQSFEHGCLDECARICSERNAIVTPCIKDFEERIHFLHGATFELVDDKPIFSAKWRNLKSKRQIHPVSSLKAPAYVIPASVYPKVAWSPLLRGWGGSEACVSLKAFFTGVPILHLCGPIAYHKFKTKFHYPVTWDEIWRNHALIARICFSERTWYDYWLPKIFEPRLNETVQREMDSAEVREEQRAFQKLKVRPDHEFWTRLVFRAVPKSVKIE